MAEEKQVTKTVSENPYISRFQFFFETQYKKPIEVLIDKYPQKKSLEVDFKELEHFDVELADDFLEKPDYLMEAASLALQEIDLPNLSTDKFSPHIRFYNLPVGSDTQPQLRNIGALHLGKLIQIEGVVAQITDVLPKLKAATWECRRCGNTYRVIQSGNVQQQPTMCECRHKDFSLKAEDSEFVDYQKIRIQEPIEYIKGNNQPTNIDIYVSDDLVNNAAPGDRTKFTGILRLMPPKEKKIVYGRFLEAIHIEETQQEFTEIEISKEERIEIEKLAKNPVVYENLIKSIAPNIYGHEAIKEAIVLQLFGGVKKVFPGQNKARGNIHVILIGEPGMAKSQLLQAVDKIAPKSIYTAGKTTSAAGISASAVKDEFGEGGWTIKAGALVLASGGIALIDELDKMDANDRSALHEAMEQESISVSKAGIVTRFKCETSILSAANPKYSRFDPYKNFIEQINLPASLMSRFDLFFLIRDVLDKKKDRQIASHILKTHRAGEMMLQKTKVKAKELQALQELVSPVIEQDLLKKYISFARQTVFPVLTEQAVEDILEFYINLREQGRKEGAYAATHRQLEGLIRLSEASAKVRLSDKVEKQDTERAIRIFKKSLEELAIDQETGRIDIDIITTGRTATELNNLKKILSIVREKGAELDMVPVPEIIEEAKTQGIDEDKTKDILGKLEKTGDVYRPRHGFVKPTQQ